MKLKPETTPSKVHTLDGQMIHRIKNIVKKVPIDDLKKICTQSLEENTPTNFKLGDRNFNKAFLFYLKEH